jgi:hypothetical protein
MWVVMNEQYRREQKEYRLKECCEDCKHYCSSRNKCGMLYPVKPHLKESFDNAKENERIYFCKMFEVK